MKEKLNQYHIIILTYMIQTGVMLFSLPRLTAENIGTNGWIALFICSGIVSINILLISLVYRWGNGESVFVIMERSVPKFVLFPFYAALSVVWALYGCMIGKKYVLLFQMISFPTTHPMVFKLLFDILVFLLIIKGIYNISKASTVFFYMSIWMLFLFLFHYNEFGLFRLTPFIFEGGKGGIVSWMDIYLAFLGYELSLFLFPYVDRKSKLIRSVFYGNLFLTFVYVVVTVTAFGFFSFGQLKSLMYPMLDMLAYIEFPFIARIESLLFTLFILKILITTVMYIWIAVEALRRIFPKSKKHVLELFTVIASYLAAFYPQVLREVDQLIRRLGYIEMVVAFAFPLLLLMILGVHRMRNRRRENHA